jgi:hypothetical protein
MRRSTFDRTPPQLSWCVRPEDVTLGASKHGPAVVLDVMHLGAVVECAVGDCELVVAVPTASSVLRSTTPGPARDGEDPRDTP